MVGSRWLRGRDRGEGERGEGGGSWGQKERQTGGQGDKQEREEKVREKGEETETAREEGESMRGKVTCAKNKRKRGR